MAISVCRYLELKTLDRIKDKWEIGFTDPLKKGKGGVLKALQIHRLP